MRRAAEVDKADERVISRLEPHRCICFDSGGGRVGSAHLLHPRRRGARIGERLLQIVDGFAVGESEHCHVMQRWTLVQKSELGEAGGNYIGRVELEVFANDPDDTSSRGSNRRRSISAGFSSGVSLS